MDLDLSGRTVTQALTFFQAAIDDCAGEELVLHIDNEVVKLNLYNHIHKAGYVCRMERKGSIFLIRVKLPPPKAGARTQPMARTTAFPVNHLSGSTRENAKPAPAPRETPKPPPPPAAAATTRRPAQRPAPKPAHVIQPPKPEPEPDRSLSWLVIQHDQIGQREVALGQELLEDILENTDVRKLAGIFLIHRGVRLLDPNYHQGRLLQCLARLKVKIKACTRSLAYFQLLDVVDDSFVEIVPAHELPRLQLNHPLIWM